MEESYASDAVDCDVMKLTVLQAGSWTDSEVRMGSLQL